MDIKLQGMGVALITPFKEDESIDFDALGRLVEYQIESKIDFLVILATTAETPTLTDKEKLEIRSFVKNKVNARIPIVLGISGNCTKFVIDEIKNTNLDGFDAILSACPSYNKPSQEGLYQHFSNIAKSTDKDIILYNVPGRTGVNMLPETTLRLANEFSNIIGIKEASGNVSQMDEIIKKKPESFNVISGDDGIAFPLMTLGAVGVISVIGNAFPKEFSRMIRLCLEGDYQNALPIHHNFTELFKLLFQDGNPAGVKCLLHTMGFIENKLRLPLVPTRLTTYQEIKKVLDDLNVKC